MLVQGSGSEKSAQLDCPGLGRSSRKEADPEKESHNSIEQDLGLQEATSAREAVELAARLNTRLRHENYGSLSFSHGFVPVLSPTCCFPEEYRAWDDLANQLPSLLSSGRLRQYCENELPVLDGAALPPQFALRAAHILGFSLHCYWHLGGLAPPKGDVVPPALALPWTAVQTVHMGRTEPHLGLYEMFINNFSFDSSKPAPSPTATCPWADAEAASFGRVEYDPERVELGSFHSVISAGTQTEYVFYGSILESHCKAHGIVKYLCDAQDSARMMDFNKTETAVANLKEALRGIKAEVARVTSAFSKIDLMDLAPHSVDAAVWAKLVGPVAVPIFKGRAGPSGAGIPIVIALDHLFGREKYANFVGQETEHVTSVLPRNWLRFIKALAAGPSMGDVVCASGDTELMGLFSACLQAYAGESGFLGRHNLKTSGFLEVAMKLGRSVTIGGFAGLLHDRAWEKVVYHLREAQEERFAVPLDARACLCSSARAIRNSEGQRHAGSESCSHVRLDIRNTGIEYRAGDRVGVLWQPSEQLVEQTLMALAMGDPRKAAQMADAEVPLNAAWRAALRLRPEYHGARSDGDAMLPAKLPLRTMLRYARLKPATREMVGMAYVASFESTLRGVLETGRQECLSAPDVLTLLLADRPEAASWFLRDTMGQEELDSAEFSLMHTMRLAFERADQNGDGVVDMSEFQSMIQPIVGLKAEVAFVAAFDEADANNDGVLEFEEFVTAIRFSSPRLCELLPPAEFRVYSVASAPSACPGELHLCVGKVQYESPEPTAVVRHVLADCAPPVQRFGAASSYLARMVAPKSERGGSDSEGALEDQGDAVVLRHFSPAKFELPADPYAQVIMFAAGSGIAPFRSFWQELAVRRSRLLAQGKPPPPPALLVLQAPKRTAVPFADELAALEGAGCLSVQVCLSQEAATNDFAQGVPAWVDAPPKTYVGDVLRADGALRARVAAALAPDGNGHAYVCASGHFAKSLADALDDVIGPAASEGLLASARLSLEVFTSLQPPAADLPTVSFSELLMMNDFCPKPGTPPTLLRLAIDGLVYDVNAFAGRHPGGRDLLHLYCGMDASSAWRAVGHHLAPEVSSLLEMYRVGRLQCASDGGKLDRDGARVLVAAGWQRGAAFRMGSVQHELYSGTDKQTLGRRRRESSVRVHQGAAEDVSVSTWYVGGWHAFASILVESRNAVTLAFQTWDQRELSSCEPVAGDGHFCTWRGFTSWRQKKSIFNGLHLAATHRRVWHEYLPSVLDSAFYLALAPCPSAVQARLAALASSSMHVAASALVGMLEEAVAEAAGEGGVVPPELHEVLEATRVCDERVFAATTAAVAQGVRAFERLPERHHAGALAELQGSAEAAMEGVVEVLEEYCAGCARIGEEAFGAHAVAAAVALVAARGPGTVGGLGGPAASGRRALVGEGMVDAGEVYQELYGARGDEGQGSCPFGH